MNDSLRHVYERIAAEDWAGAREALNALQTRESERADVAADVRHDIANAVAVLKVNVEGMLDGVVEPTHERLETLYDALTGITSTLERWRRSRI